MVQPIIFPLYNKQQALSLSLQLPDYQFEFITEPIGNHFVWDGELLYWHDQEAGDLHLDFLSPKMQWRVERINKAQEPLLRALGWKGNQSKRVYDLTAGLGRDAALLYFAGFEVTMFERNPILQCLLTYALSKFKAEVGLTHSLTLQKKDAIEILTQPLTSRPDLIYLDPMYPARKKSALVKKELRIIRNLVGADDDSETLLTVALNSGVARVVVKRPAKAEYVGGRKPSHSIESPNTRFDVYLNQL